MKMIIKSRQKGNQVKVTMMFKDRAANVATMILIMGPIYTIVIYFEALSWIITALDKLKPDVKK